jgi:hypothetical protein
MIKNKLVGAWLAAIVCLALFYSCKKEKNNTPSPNDTNKESEYLNTSTGWEHVITSHMTGDFKPPYPTSEHIFKGFHVYGDSAHLITQSFRNINGPIVFNHIYSFSLNKPEAYSVAYVGGDYNPWVSFDNYPTLYLNNSRFTGGSTWLLELIGTDGTRRWRKSAQVGGEFLLTKTGRIFSANNGYFFVEIGFNDDGVLVTNPMYPSMLNPDFFYCSSTDQIQVAYQYGSHLQIASTLKESLDGSTPNSHLANVAFYKDSTNALDDSCIIKVSSPSADNTFKILLYKKKSGIFTTLYYNAVTHSISILNKNVQGILGAQYADISAEGVVYLATTGLGGVGVANFTKIAKYKNRIETSIPENVIKSTIPNPSYYKLAHLYLKGETLFGVVNHLDFAPELPDVRVIRFTK